MCGVYCLKDENVQTYPGLSVKKKRDFYVALMKVLFERGADRVSDRLVDQKESYACFEKL